MILKKNIKLATYVARCIENEILMFLRGSKKTKSEVYLNEPIGKDKDEITKILGNYDYVNEECICYDVRLYKDIVYDTYCLYYNIDNIIIDTSKTWK